MSKPASWRPFAAIAVLLLTAAIFINYWVTHPSVLQDIKNIPTGTLALVLFLYVLFTGTLAMVNAASLRLCRQRMPAGESILLTMYSAIINFFGPLQSGPAFRAVYVKQKYAVKIRHYTLASFVYYFFYALYSVLLLFSGVLKWWLVPIGLIALLLAVKAKNADLGPIRGLNNLDFKHWRFMAFAALLQTTLLVVIFGVELRAVQAGVSLSQIVIYTGAANLALFVSFTPGAIGFREAFLVFSQNLHHIGSTTIVAANLIDRTVYILLLGILAVFIFATHANRRLKKVAQSSQKR
jgi:uncharacterized membrane protein YbhN (UPF0104 family)